jgi:hypothetical protein
MGNETYANFYAYEGTATTDVTITFPHRVGRVTITNDSATTELSFKFQSGYDYGTLAPTETVSMEIRTGNIFLTSTNAAYRV